jgi:hypothetical protein
MQKEEVLTIFQYFDIHYSLFGVLRFNKKSQQRAADSRQQPEPLNLLYETLMAGTVNRLNVEHRTSNIELRILMALRFIYFKTMEAR